MEKNELSVAIRVAFETVLYPGDDNIGDPEGRDDAERVTEWLRGVEWPTLTSKADLWEFGLYYMTPEASHYYLPAYLIVALENITGNAMEGVKLRVRPYDGPHPYPKEIFSRFVALLLPEQKQVLYDFLLYSKDAAAERYLQEGENHIASLFREGLAEYVDDSRTRWSNVAEEARADFLPLIGYWRDVQTATIGGKDGGD